MKPIDSVRHHPFHYVLHGLALACNAPLAAPGLRQRTDGADTGPPDVLVEWIGVAVNGAQAAASPAGPPVPGTHVIAEATGGWLAVSHFAHLEDDWTRLRFGYAGHHVQFDIASGGARVTITWTPEILPAAVSTLLLSTVMNYLLYAQGRVALHASVVAWQNVAFAFVGGPGAGKSTTVAALIAHGCSVVSEDVAALSRRSGRWGVFPGLTSMRLTPQALAVLGIPEDATAPLWPRPPQISPEDDQKLCDKAVISFAETQDSSFAGAPLPLAGVFILPPRIAPLGAPQIIALPAAAAVPRLAEHLLTPAWLRPVIDRKRFATMVDLARHTLVRSVERPDSLAGLPQLCAALLDEMAHLRQFV